MISACMLDGFGWFHEADYRRSWLFFDDVSYVLPAEPITGLLAYPAHLEQRIEFKVDRLVLASDAEEAIAEQALRDSSEPRFRELCDAVPTADADYAQTVMWADSRARARVGTKFLSNKYLALSYLLNKLTHCAQSRGLCPLVGQPYASDMLAWKAGQRERSLPWKVAPARDAYAAFAAGLSLDFLDDSDLVEADIESLAQFKEQNVRLLAESQRSILSTSERFALLSAGPEFQRELAELRARARDERRALDARAKAAWQEAGLAIAKKAISAGATALAGGVLLSSFTTGAVATAIAATAVVATELIEPLAHRKKSEAGMAYLYRLGALSREAALGLPRSFD